MSLETKALFGVDGHPDEDQLLLALERELPIEDAARIERHLGNCWSCRARFDEMQRGILAFVEYREKRYLPSLAKPPADFANFPNQLRTVLSESAASSLLGSLWRKLTALFALPKQVRWASLVATTLAVVILWIDVFNPPAVSANELLARARAAQNPLGSSSKSAPQRVVHQRVQIRGGTQTIVKDFEWKIGDSGHRPLWGTEQELRAWNAPMTAEGFSDWRNSLQDRKDNIKRSGRLLTLDTVAGQNFIKEAWIVVRADDFHPIAQHLRFADDQQLDFTELVFQVDDIPKPMPASSFQTVAPAKTPKAAPLPSRAELDETELQLRYILFKNQWGLGDDLAIGRTSSQVTLSGIVSSKEREKAMHATLSTLPHLRFLIEQPSVSSAQAANSSASVTMGDQVASSAPLLKDTLEKAFASRDERLNFVDRCLADSDAALSHAWALKRLVDRYSEAEEQRLKPDSEGKLREMLRAHLRELGSATSRLEPLLDLLPASSAAEPIRPSGWRAGILALFAAVQQQDHLVASLVAVSHSNRPDRATSSDDLRSTHRAIALLLTGLKDDLAGNATAK
jgi:hypothetical protein